MNFVTFLLYHYTNFLLGFLLNGGFEIELYFIVMYVSLKIQEKFNLAS